MAAAPFDLIIEQGTDYETRLTLTHKPAPDAPAVPVDLTGCSLRAQIRPHRGADAGLLYDLGGGLAITDPAAGHARLFIPGEDSAAWTWRTGVWDLELLDAGGRPRRLLQGTVRVDPEVTR
ncbi:hypothetical protein [Spongiactinospora sp. 9N601]|uniref:hypothetical protein n=1 Tax=Spongiactinospora sp. 9N601 TaxID=3375149 RepID=UPI0037A697B9